MHMRRKRNEETTEINHLSAQEKKNEKKVVPNCSVGIKKSNSYIFKHIEMNCFRLVFRDKKEFEQE
jgi:hypothetical protein